MLKLVMDLITVFHATDSDLSKLDYQQLLSNIKNHDNGALGLWCSFKKDWIRPFGKSIYQLEVSGSFYKMSITELAGYNHKHYSQEDYTHKRNCLLNQGFDYIKIIECSGLCEMIVLLNFTKAKISLLE